MDTVISVYHLTSPATTRIGLLTLPVFYLRNISPDNGTQLDIDRHVVAYYESVDPSAKANILPRPLFTGSTTVVVNANKYWTYFLVEREEDPNLNPVPFLPEPVFHGPLILAVKDYFYTATISDIRWTRIMRFFFLLSEIEWPDIHVQPLLWGSPAFLWEEPPYSPPPLLWCLQHQDIGEKTYLPQLPKGDPTRQGPTLAHRYLNLQSTWTQMARKPTQQAHHRFEA
ncbi:hypothetical protein CONPUDRAFT_68941 [Coniophora puteana RWD-64-598 SS2]|uniref:Uncharacterized protein n=1 Tax=Coniophora puteana (strain RWD-64-598) TaxID=741705 RepID=A0A5M3N4U1_CONPW|nr:uncharacterized protein CONPUDRAFT_68941 [Coniophora puteana RWD-64-598 SS2]EIW86413.1 hypothetical protein CONPUDRAFT_68941 [Coniophora puteana RWD-64-598 SS2]